MAVKFLDNTGLGYFWSKIKAWCNATFAAITHNQASSTINAMTGYSKPNSTSAIATSDTLNQAIGKLEKAIDDADITNTVHLTGNEFVGGIKEFGNSYYDSTIEGETDWESSSLIIRYQNYIKGSGAPSVNKHANLLFLDKTGNNVNWSGRLGAVESAVNPSGSYGIHIACYKNEIIDNFDTHDRSMLSVGYDENGIKHASCPSTSSSRTDGGDIVTRDWIPKDTRIVHTTGNEEIGGLKWFHGDIISNFDIAKGGHTSAVNNYYWGIYLTDNTATFADYSHVKRFGRLEFYYGMDGTTYAMLSAYRGTNSDVANIFVGFDGNGNRFAKAPSTSSSRTDGGDIVTRDWIPQDTRIVHTTGNETVGGEKTFTSGPIIANNSPSITVKDTNGEKGNTAGWALGHWFYDKNNKPLGNISCGRYGNSSDKHNAIGLRAYKCNSASDTDFVQIYLNYYSTGIIALEPESSDVVLLGRNSRKWKEVWCTQSSINSSSDERLKDDIESIPDEVLDAWDGINWIQFKFKKAKQEKGNNARFHTGAIAQSIDSVFTAHGLKADNYGLFLYDEWDAVPEVVDENGTIQQRAQPAGNEYGLRYVEALCMEAAYQRRKNKILENRISELERQVSDMLQILQSLKGAN